MRVNILFYSMYGHMYQMAQAAQKGAEAVDGVEAQLLRIPETLPEEVLKMMGALEAQKQFEGIPAATMEDLAQGDGFIFGLPTRYGRMSAQWANFLDQSGQLWQQGALAGKPVGLMSSSGTQHGGQETTIISTAASLMHHGMLVVGLPLEHWTQIPPDEASGGTPYGASTFVGDGSRMPSDRELAAAEAQGKWVAELTKKLKA